MTTANLSLPELVQGQTGADITHNEAINLLDVIVQTTVQNMTTSASGSAIATEGYVYIPIPTASGDWDASWEYKIAAYIGAQWVKITPKSGWKIHNLDDQKQYTYNGATWDLTQMEPEVLDTEFRVVKSTDSTSKMDFDMSKVATSTTTTFIMPNGDVEFAKTNLSGTTAPTVSNDNTEDYEPGSIWVDETNDLAYLCVDASTGAAIWRQMAGATGTGDVSTTGTVIDNTVVRYHTTTGDDIQSSKVVIDDDGELYGNKAKILEKSAAYTYTDVDCGKVIVVTSGTFNITLPQTSTETIAVGSQCTVINRGAGTITFVKEGSDVIESKNSYVALEQHSAATVIKLDDTTVNTWGLYGDLS